MLKVNELQEKIASLLANEESKTVVSGNGITAAKRYTFNQSSIDQSKRDIAAILKELGIDEVETVSVEDFTTLKDGSEYIGLRTMGEYDTLELLIACADACGFIRNNAENMRKSNAELGRINTVLLSDIGRKMVGNDSMWLNNIKNNVIGHIRYATNQRLINSCVPTEMSKQFK